MKRILILLLFLGFAVQASSQAFLLVENTRRFKNYKYYPGDDIMVSTFSSPGILSGTVTGFTDSTVLIGEWTEVRLDDIRQVRRKRGGIRYFSGAFLVAGTFYFGIDLTNRLINNDAPVVPVETALISGGLIGTGFLLKVFGYKKLNSGDWKYVIIDPSGF